MVTRHGIDINKRTDLEYMENVFREAADFYDCEVVRNAQASTPLHRELKDYSKLDGIYRIFRIAAGQGRRQLIPQACALLRIALVIDFMNRDPLISMIPEAENQLRDIIARHVQKVKGQGLAYYATPNDDQPIPLFAADTRTKKRERIIAKLLQKPSNHTADVLDHIGFRFITRSAADTLRLIYRMFCDPSISALPLMNIRSAETKQMLLNSAELRRILSDDEEANRLFQRLADTAIDHQDSLIIPAQDETAKMNRHSSRHFRAILITVDLPVYVNGKRTMFPIEIQFLDQISWLNNHVGGASHGGYVARQRRTAMHRLFDRNLAAAFLGKPSAKK